MAAVSQLPVEVLHHIFELLKQPLPYIPQFRLASLTRVCKHWQPIAERLLYQSVAIGDDLHLNDVYAKDENPYLEMLLDYIRYYNNARAHNLNVLVRRGSLIIGHLLETLQKNQRLAAFVTELQLLIPDEHESNSDEEAHRSAKILAACPNVKHVEITFGLKPFAVESLTESLMLKESLVSFKVNHRLEGEDSDTRLWTAPTLLRMMRKWRQIEHVELSPFVLSPNGRDDEGEAELNCCPKLQTISLHQCYYEEQAMLRSLDLRNLLRMCPTGIKTFRAALAMDEGTLDVLGDCIRAWAPTLEDIHIRKSSVDETSSSPPLSDCVANLTSLKFLALESLILDPCVLSTLPKLTHLCVAWALLEEKRGLLLAMAQNKIRTFPALQTLHIGEGNPPFVSQHAETLDELKWGVVEDRGIVYDDGYEGVFS